MLFERVLVGVDGSEAASTALRLCRRLLVPQGELLAVTVAEVHLAAHAGMDATVWAEQIDRDAHAGAERAERELDGIAAEARVVRGHAAPTLLATAGEIGADLIAVGSHGASRAAGIALGSVATRVIHDAPCSVLVARGEPDPGAFPRSIVVGIDTSPEAVEAQVAALALGATYGTRVRPLTSTGGRPLPAGAALIADLDARSPVEALVDASRTSDLIIVGSRGLHGVKALGSVAERVAHRAHCPVLIVRVQAAAPTSSASSYHSAPATA